MPLLGAHSKEKAAVLDGTAAGSEWWEIHSFFPLKTVLVKRFVLKAWRFFPDLVACGWT